MCMSPMHTSLSDRGLVKLIDSVGKRRGSLEKTTHTLATKFKIGGASCAIAPDYQLHVALLVCHVFGP
jgi:hypothetical protein